MKVLSISTDRNIFKENSPVRLRMVKHAELFEEFHIVIFSSLFLHREVRQKKIQIAPNAWIYPTRSWSRFFYMRDAVKLGDKILRSINGDKVITAQDPFETGTVGLRLKKRISLPLQVQIHTDFLSPHFAHTFLNRIRLRMAEKVLPQADGIRVVSKRVFDSLISRFQIDSKRISILPVFVDVEKMFNAPVVLDLHKKYPQFNFIILMASRLTEEKDIPLGIKIFKKIQSTFPRAGLVIVGSGPLLTKLKKLTFNLGLKDSVVFENWQNDLASYYKTANLFLLTSEYEGFSMTLLEAAAAGCPIVTSDVGIVGDIFKHEEHVLVCPPHDKDCFIINILELVSNNNKRELMKQSAKGRVLQAFTLKEDEYMKKYAELMNLKKAN